MPCKCILVFDILFCLLSSILTRPQIEKKSNYASIQTLPQSGYWMFWVHNTGTSNVREPIRKPFRYLFHLSIKRGSTSMGMDTDKSYAYVPFNRHGRFIHTHTFHSKCQRQKMYILISSTKCYNFEGKCYVGSSLVRRVNTKMYLEQNLILNCLK